MSTAVPADQHIAELNGTIGERLLKPTVIYAPVIRDVLAHYKIKSVVHGIAHITGGGLPGNLNRVLPEGCDAEIERTSWPVLPIFSYLAKAGNLDETDIYSAFNMGIGYVLVVPASAADTIMRDLAGMGETAYRVGRIIRGDRKVRLI